MAYNTSDSAPRADISTLLMEAVGQEKLFVGQIIMPVFPSPTQVGRYPKFRIQRGDLLRKYGGSTARLQTGGYPETDRAFEWDSYQTSEYGLEERVDDAVARAMENFFDAEMVTAKLIMNELMLDYEQTVASTINSPTTFTSTNSSVAYGSANVATMDVPYDMNAIVERLTLYGEPPDCAIMSLTMWNLIRRSQKLQTYVYGFLNVTQGGSQITEQMFAQVFGLKEIIIAKKSIDTALKGTAPTLTPIWGNTYIAVGRRGEGDFMNGGVGRTIVWDADSPGGLFTTESYRNEARRGTIERVRSNRTVKVINPICLQLINTQYLGS